MPFLYFLVSGDYAKFGHTKDVDKRGKQHTASNASDICASVEYDLDVSNGRLLDNHIYDEVLQRQRKNSLVEFKVNTKTGRKTDWFRVNDKSAHSIMFFLRVSSKLCDKEQFDVFKATLLRLCQGYLLCIPQLENREYRAANAPECLTNCIESYINTAMSKLDIKNSFFEQNYEPDGMIPEADVKRHPHWSPQCMTNIETSFVNICKSCGRRALKGCCSESSRTNRKKLKMVIGWHARDDI